MTQLNEPQALIAALMVRRVRRVCEILRRGCIADAVANVYSANMSEPNSKSKEASVWFVVAAVAIGMIGSIIVVYIGMVLFD